MNGILEAVSPSHPLVELPDPPIPALRFLETEATSAQLLQAIAANHLKWFAQGAVRLTRSAKGGGSVTWICKPDDITIAFPRLTSTTASETLDIVVADCRQRAPKQAGCWAMTPTLPRDLGARLCARGFEWGWQPHWMALNLHDMRADFPLPEGLHIAVDSECDWDVDDLPYYNREKSGGSQVAGSKRQRVWHFGAWLDSKIVGHSTLFVTTGAMGVGGIYNVGVVPAARGQGVGRAISLAACQFARALGCHYATLNAATHIYDRLGFVSLGHGQTWWMHASAIAAPPTREQIAFAEAIGRGVVKSLNALDRHALPLDLNAPLPCGMTPIDLAVKVGKPASVEWLVSHGATLDVLHAWDLGWKERAVHLLAETPDRVNQRSGKWQMTLLHEAAMRGDAELARLLLAAHPDLSLRDAEFNGTPLGWARHFQRADIIALIEQHQMPQK